MALRARACARPQLGAHRRTGGSRALRALRDSLRTAAPHRQARAPFPGETAGEPRRDTTPGAAPARAQHTAQGIRHAAGDTSRRRAASRCSIAVRFTMLHQNAFAHRRWHGGKRKSSRRVGLAKKEEVVHSPATGRRSLHAHLSPPMLQRRAAAWCQCWLSHTLHDDSPCSSNMQAARQQWPPAATRLLCGNM